MITAILLLQNIHENIDTGCYAEHTAVEADVKIARIAPAQTGEVLVKISACAVFLPQTLSNVDIALAVAAEHTLSAKIVVGMDENVERWNAGFAQDIIGCTADDHAGLRGKIENDAPLDGEQRFLRIFVARRIGEQKTIQQTLAAAPVLALIGDVFFAVAALLRSGEDDLFIIKRQIEAFSERVGDAVTAAAKKTTDGDDRKTMRHENPSKLNVVHL